MALLDLLPTSAFTLAYALPLLLFSILSTFAGSFLTLDRTRSFTPRADTGYATSLPGARGGSVRKHLRIPLEGGLGGLVGGYLFGVHAATFLALIIPAMTSSAPLSNKSFVPVWLLSALTTTVLGARFRYAALAFYGVAGGASLALSICIISHPSLLARTVLLAVITPLLALLALVPFPATQHWGARIGAAALGAFGLVVAIAALARVPAWANAWERLWTADGAAWGTRAEQGLSAAWALLFAGGIAADWLLRRRFGENPDERWDAYLADYATSLPNAADRAGVFEPLTSPFHRLLHKHDQHGAAPGTPPPPFADRRRDSLAKIDEFDEEATLADAAPPPPYPVKLAKLRAPSTKSRPLDDLEAQHAAPGAFEYARRPGFLKKKTSSAASRPTRARGQVKFRPLNGDDLSSSDGESDGEPPRSPASTSGGKLWLRTKASATLSTSGTTLADRASIAGSSSAAIDVDKEIAAIRAAKAGGGGALEYSDYEGSDGESAKKPAARDAPGWSPAFLARHGSQRRTSTGSGRLTTDDGHGSSSGLTTPMKSVPATPSLIRAFDRIAVAQEAAYGPSSGSASSGARPLPGSGFPFPQTAVPGMPPPPAAGDDKHDAEKWTRFWKDVKDKAAPS